MMNFDLKSIRDFAKRNSLARLLAYSLRDWPLLAGAVLFLLTNSLLDLAVPWVMGFLLTTSDDVSRTASFFGSGSATSASCLLSWRCW